MEYTLWISIATMGGLGLLFAGALAIADKKLCVEENPLIGQINELLPSANCGACGNAGCYDFAVKLVEGKTVVTGCPVGGPDLAKEISQLLGIESSESVKLVARVLCKGGNIEAIKKTADYYGPMNCKAASLVAGGEKLCQYGCLGGGDCVEACKFDAIIMGENGLPKIIEELCTGCGLCAQACSRNLIELHPINREFFVFCKNHDDPKRAKEVCAVACTGCGICARVSEGAIEIKDYLPIIDYLKLDASKFPVEKCRQGAIGFINGNSKNLSAN